MGFVDRFVDCFRKFMKKEQDTIEVTVSGTGKDGKPHKKVITCTEEDLEKFLCAISETDLK